MKKYKKLLMRLLVLVVLIAGAFFVHQDNVSAGGNCEWDYQACMNECEQGNGPCYAACYMTYFNCTFNPD